MKAATDGTTALRDLAAAEAREIAGGDDTASRAPIYDENGNVIGGCTPDPFGKLPAQY
jgi:hypothetical protein